MNAATAFKVLTHQQWVDFERERVFRGAPVDIADGYIHLSTADQLEGTLAKHFAGQGCLIDLHFLHLAVVLRPALVPQQLEDAFLGGDGSGGAKQFGHGSLLSGENNNTVARFTRGKRRRGWLRLF